ncbi:MAG: hypothetical protein AAFZ07_14700 [Actinomycetota bacterium]
MDGPTLFDVDGEPTVIDDRRAAAGDEQRRWHHPSTAAHRPASDEYRRRVREAASELQTHRTSDTRARLAAAGRRRSRGRLDDPRPEVRESERSRRRLLRLVH